MFNPHATYRHEVTASSQGCIATKVALEALIQSDLVKWTIWREQYIVIEGVHHAFWCEVDSRYVSTMNYSHDPEWQARIIQSRFFDLIGVLSSVATEAAGHLVWRIFCDLYYPREVEDRYNEWIREAAPALHDKMIETLRLRNQAIVKQVMET